MKTIPLTRGFSAKVDDSDYEPLSKFKWCVVEPYPGKFYARRRTGNRHILMHQQIAGDGVTKFDHEDGDGLNNQRLNLRPATLSQNQGNKQISKSNKSGFKGVVASRNKWAASVRFNGYQKYLGVHATPDLAARAYDRAAVEIWGEFALTNQKLGLL